MTDSKEYLIRVNAEQAGVLVEVIGNEELIILLEDDRIALVAWDIAQVIKAKLHRSAGVPFLQSQRICPDVPLATCEAVESMKKESR